MKKVMICGVDCHHADRHCNGYCTGQANRPPAPTPEMVLDAARQRLTASLEPVAEAYSDLLIAVNDVPKLDNDLLDECLILLERATYHDGRYGQKESDDWQIQAQTATHKLAMRLGRKPYEFRRNGQN